MAGYLGNAPTAVPLTSADITDGIITSAKIANGAITGDDINSTFNLTGKTVTLPAGTGGKVLQVVTVNDNTQYAAAADGVEYTQLQLSITPSGASSKILVSVNLGLVGADSGADFGVVIKRTIGVTTTSLQVGSSGSACTFVSGMSFIGAGNALSSSYTLIDSPSTTSSCTYEIFIDINSPRTIYINRRGADDSFSSSSSLHLMEIGA